MSRGVGPLRDQRVKCLTKPSRNLMPVEHYVNGAALPLRSDRPCLSPKGGSSSAKRDSMRTADLVLLGLNPIWWTPQ